MARKTLKTTGLDELQANNEEIAKKVDDLVTAKPAKATKPASKPFKKPNSDYYRLDLILRDVVDGKMVEDIKTDYMSFVKEEAHKHRVSIAKYIQSLIDKQMNKADSLFRSSLVGEISKMKNLPYITDSDHAITEELEKVLDLYDKLETM